MQKQRLICNHPSILGKSTSGVQKAIVCQQRKTRRIPTGSARMRPPKTKTRLSPIAPPPPLISLRPRLPRKTSAIVGEAMEVIQPLESMLPR